MNYKKIYRNLFEKAKSRKNILTETYEAHHFIPKGLYKVRVENNKIYKELIIILNTEHNNQDDNVYKITLREHYIAHLLLFRIFPKLENILLGLNQVYNRYKKSKYYSGSSGWRKWRLKCYNIISEKNKGYVMAKNKLTKENIRVTVEEFENNDILVGANYFSNTNKNIHKCNFCDLLITGNANFAQHNKYFCKNQETSQVPWMKKERCQYCNREMNKNKISKHQSICFKNPTKENSSTYNSEKIKCQFCDIEGKSNVIKRHEKYDCEKNINKIKRKPTKMVICQNCKIEINSRGLYNHQKRCKGE